MNLTAAISNLRLAETASQVSMAVVRTALDSQKAQGEAVIELVEAVAETMEQAATQTASLSADLGANLDRLA